MEDEALKAAKEAAAETLTKAEGAAGMNKEGVCFPGVAMVTLASDDSNKTSDLVIGDHVVVGNSLTSPVFMFTHALEQSRRTFVRLIYPCAYINQRYH